MLHSPASQSHSRTAHIYIHSLNSTDGFWAALNHNCGLRALRHGSVVFFWPNRIFMFSFQWIATVRWLDTIYSSSHPIFSLCMSHSTLCEKQKRAMDPIISYPHLVFWVIFIIYVCRKKTYLVWLSSSRSNNSDCIGGFRIESRHWG